MIIKALKFLKSQMVLTISLLCAVITCLFVTPDKKYLSYVDANVLILLFCLMGAVQGFSQAGLFHRITASLTRSSNARRLGFLLMNVCFFSSMLITNDVALITFVPLTVMIYTENGRSKDFILTVVIQTISANLGSMLTPVGNPQNLFIYSFYNLTLLTFFKTLLPVGVLGYGLLWGLCFLISKEDFSFCENPGTSLDKKQLVAFSAIFAVCLLTVVRVIPHPVCLVLCIVGFLVANRKVFAKIDYPLLLTFVCFFVFVGNLGRITAVSDLIGEAMKNREVVVSALLSQIISNVPACVMLSGFTDNYTALLKGVNIGGLGTPIASLASLISFKIYTKSQKADVKKYLLIFSTANFGMLAIMLFIFR